MLVSVIIPSYNYRQYLKEAVDSVLSQIFSDYEIIIVDDGSKPEVYQFVKKIAEQNTRIQLYSHPGRKNKGLAEPLQLGIKKVKANGLLFLKQMIFGLKIVLRKELN